MISFFSLFGPFITTLDVDDELETLSLKKDINSLSERALGAMSCLAGQYPFPNLFKETKENHYSFNPYDDGKPVIFSNLDEIRSWVESMKRIIKILSGEFRGDGHLLYLLTDFSKSEYVSKRKNDYMTQRTFRQFLLKPMTRGTGRPFMSILSLDPLKVYHDYMEKITEVKDIVWSTTIYIQSVDALTERYPSKRMLNLIFFLIVIAFGIGVIYPLIAEKMRRIFVLWIPLGIYTIIGILIF